VKRVTVLGFEYAFASAITGITDVLSMAGITWNRIQGDPSQKHFEVTIASEGGKPIRCSNGIEIQAHKSLEEVAHTDLLLVPTIAGNIEKTLLLNQSVLPWLRKHFEQGADIASNCTGAFFLAEAGLLDGKQATTHWGYVDQFEQRYPKVNLKASQLITSDGSVFCSGGGTAWLDMALFLIERYCGYDVAVATAKSHVFDLRRTSQSAYSNIVSKKYHHDHSIQKIQDWLGNHYHQSINISLLATKVSMTERTFKRRFKQATGESTINYLQNIRIEAAKKLLEHGNLSVERITHDVGYEDMSSFIRLFKKQTALSPSAYRAKFSRC